MYIVHLVRPTRESTVQKTYPSPQHLKTGTNKGMGQETHTQTNRTRRPRQEQIVTTNL